jgi:hypothetical protein
MQVLLHLEILRKYFGSYCVIFRYDTPLLTVITPNMLLPLGSCMLQYKMAHHLDMDNQYKQCYDTIKIWPVKMVNFTNILLQTFTSETSRIDADA